MIIKPLGMDDISACADILCAVYNNELWMCRWDKKTAMDYLQDFYDHKKFVGFTAWEDDKMIGALLPMRKSGGITVRSLLRKCLFFRKNRDGVLVPCC